MLAAQQAAIDANPDHEFYSLNIDAGGMWVRRILDRMLAGRGPGRRRTAQSGPRSVGAMSTGTQPDWRHRPGRRQPTTVAQDIRRITIERPARGRARPRAATSTSACAIGDATDVRSYSVVESDDERRPADHQRAPGAAVTRRLGLHALARRRRRARGHAAAAELPARVGAPGYVLLAGGIGITALVGDGARAARRGRRLHARLRRPQPRADGLRRRAGRPPRRPARGARRRRGTPLDVADLVGSIGAHPRARTPSSTCAGRSG